MKTSLFHISFSIFNVLGIALFAQSTEVQPAILDPNIGVSTDVSALTKLNGKISRFSASWYFDGIAYIGQNSPTKRSFYQIWYSPGIDASDALPFVIDPPSNIGLNYGPLTWDNKNNIVYYTRNKTDEEGLVKDDRGRVKLQIYRARTETFNKWNEVEPVFPENAGFSNCHPTLWSSENRLIFASDRPDGAGGMDLYEVVKLDGKWSEPVSLGTEINSEGHDIFPFIHSSGYLIFASNRDGTEGLDMFLAKYQDGRWINLGKLPAPFNGEGDDFGLILDEEARTGIMNSNGNSTRGQDWLYKVESLEPLLPIPERETILPTLIVIDRTSGQPISGADVGLFAYKPELFEDSTGLFRSQFQPGIEGEEEMTVKYVLNRQMAENFLKVSGNSGEAKVEIPDADKILAYASHPEYQTGQLIISRDSLSRQESLGLELVPDLRKHISIQFISIMGELLSDLDVFLTEQNSSESKYFPIEDDRFLRTQLYEYKEYRMVVVKDGYKTKNFTFKLADEEVGDDIIVYLEPDDFIEEEPNEAEEPLLVLEQILYDYDDSEIKHNYAFELDLLADMLEKFPEISVELSAHTDSRGNDAYNQKLSERRAIAAKEYLVEKGVDPSRIIAVGYGETRLRNGCSDGVECTEEEHQYNRRTEVRVISEK
jgi:outer membrane protein OmpA-like peptidoglycan-associated protein